MKEPWIFTVSDTLNHTFHCRLKTLYGSRKSPIWQ